MKSSDLLTAQEVRTRLDVAASDLRAQAEADAAALAVEQDTYERDLEASAAAEVVAHTPAMSGVQQNGGLGDTVLSGASSSHFESTFSRAQQDALSAVAGGVDQFVAIVLQEAVKTIDELREVADELAVESAQLASAAASGLLVPPTRDDIEDLQDELASAKSQAILVQREVKNLRARRQASRVADGSERQPDEFPIARSLDGRPLVRTAGASESSDRDDQGSSLAQGVAGQTRSRIAEEQNEMLQELLRRPALDRVAYIAVCSAIGNMKRSKTARDKAVKATEKLKGIYLAIKNILSGAFLGDLQENLENQAQKSIDGAVDFIQDKIDAADGFLQAIARLPGPFVSTVSAIGEQPQGTPVIDSLSALCGLKGARFCDLQGLIEVAISLDIEFGLRAPALPMFGRAVLTLDPPEESQAPSHVVVPGQEADLILVSLTGTQLVARFSRQRAPVAYDATTQSFKERPDVFGNGAGKIVLLGNGTQQDQEVVYSAVSYNAATNNYTFTLTTSPTSRVPTVRGEADNTALAGLTGPAGGALPTTPVNSWNPTVSFPVGATVVTMRAPEAQARDIVTPCDVAIGYGEQILISGEYDATTAGTVRALQGTPFASWMTGLTIDLGPASATAQAQRRVITYVNPTTVTYAGANVPGHLSGGSRGAFRLTIDAFETRRATSTSPGPHPDLIAFNLQTPTSRPHARLLALPQAAVRVVPDVRDNNLNAVATPANPDVRDRDILPAGATVFSATFAPLDGQDPAQSSAAQDAYWTPILVAAGVGKAFIGGQGPFSYTSVSDEPGPTLRFTLSSGTPQPFAAGTRVEVETMSLLDRFGVEFPDTWFDPIDLWLAQLGDALSRLEAKFCRLLSGSPQDIAASATALSALATAVSLQLTAARFAFMAWLVPLTQANSLTRALDSLDGMGASRASKALREGKISEFASMSAAEGTQEGNFLVVAQEYQQRVTTDEQYRVLAKAVAEIRGRFDSLMAATNAVGNIKAAQAAELERRQLGSRRIQTLQEELP